MVSGLSKKIKLLLLPKQRRIYVVLHGRYKGEWLVKVKEEQDKTTFFSLPDRYIRVIPNKDFEWGVTNKVLEPVDVLSKDIYNVCLYYYNEKVKNDEYNNTLDRRK